MKKKKKGTVWTLVIVVFIVLLGAGNGWFSASDDSTVVESISAVDGADLAKRLAAAEAAHGICYGWELHKGTSTTGKPLSEGSSRGVGVNAETCQRYMILRGSVDYTSADSVLEDSAYLSVDSSSDLRSNRPSTADLDRVGVSTASMLNEPAATTGYGALALPLLLAEKGVVAPVPEPTTAAAPATPIGRPGSDFTSNRQTALVLVTIFGGVALFGVAIGFLISRKRGQER
ncbi:hypothetical protein [Actinokineospora iranica]|uniref:Uncharacterized protein n=1 Tax=Actinokineospora iranica TaxID=1271860 RepID=A0A1G6YYN6_9PSEU|nr:hypothetical protein [Actinokineospora iranica]SDD95173.1 hypothetical protein SAMN05216174_12433 [Actinokineospora iranica]